MIDLMSLVQAGRLAVLISRKLKKSPVEERKGKRKELYQAVKNIEENQDTKELEKWISKNL